MPGPTGGEQPANPADSLRSGALVCLSFVTGVPPKRDRLEPFLNRTLYRRRAWLDVACSMLLEVDTPPAPLLRSCHSSRGSIVGKLSRWVIEGRNAYAHHPQTSRHRPGQIFYNIITVSSADSAFHG